MSTLCDATMAGWMLQQEEIPARIQQMIAVLLANQDLICQYSYGHIELHYKDRQVQASIKHQLLAE